MNVSVDETSEQRIKREIELGHFKNPEEGIAHALELLDAKETWLHENRELIRLKIEHSFSQIEREKGFRVMKPVPSLTRGNSAANDKALYPLTSSGR